MTPWWQEAVLYQIYPRSFADSDGDGMGDLPGITSRLDYVRDLGVDGIWVSPFYLSPMNDAGYDVADYRRVDPVFGSTADADALLRRAHELGLKVLVDLVPNHTSSEHAWFQAALAAGPGSPERARYHFRDGQGRGGAQPPNRWRSVFGGPGWTRVVEPDGTPGQWYLHLFDVTQPDLNWEHPQVRAEFLDILRYWLDRGVDGFRVDVAHALVKAPGLPDYDDAPAAPLTAAGDERPPTHLAPMWDQDGVHEIYRSWRALLDSYGEPARILCAEAWVHPVERAMLYVRPDEMHQSFAFDFLDTPWRAADLREVIAHDRRALASVGAAPTWVLSNHDVVRTASRLGLPAGSPRPNGLGPRSSVRPDPGLGLRRARAAATLMLALPGAAYLYQGEELGLPDHLELPDEVRQDPVWVRTEHRELGRDGCRVPLPWVGDAPSLGFGPSERTWLPQPPEYAALAVDQQVGRPGSTLELYRRLLTLRREHGVGSAALTELTGYGDEVIAYRLDGRSGALAVVVNLGASGVELPGGSTLLVASDPLVAGRLPTDTAAWVLLAEAP
ncbi:MAG TPA: glycoside hydrolase family 13 protein [Dermatophilaceae bacterium]|nr:glycoside hydrolase family 13 protein [Dermatophilaceae bacterium]